METTNTNVDELAKTIFAEFIEKDSKFASKFMDLYTIIGIKDSNMPMGKIRPYTNAINGILDNCINKKSNYVDKNLLIKNLVIFYTYAYYKQYKTEYENDKMRATVFDDEMPQDIEEKVKLSVCASLRELTRSNNEKNFITDHNNKNKVSIIIEPGILVNRLINACATLNDESARKSYDERRKQAELNEYSEVLNMVNNRGQIKHPVVFPNGEFIEYNDDLTIKK